MGKKRIIQKSGEELVKSIEDVEKKITQEGMPAAFAKKAGKGAHFYIYSSYNNTIMTLTDEKGNVIQTVSAGAIGFKGSKKSTPFAASKVAEVLTQTAKQKGVERVRIYVKGVGPGRDSALRSLGAKGFDLLSVEDVTPIPHNGPRPRKVRRV